MSLAFGFDIQLNESLLQHPLKVQESAHSAMAWLARNGGEASTHDMVSQLSKVGASGKFPNNAERDTHRLVHRVGRWLDATIELKSVRMIDPSTMEESVQKLPMILPHQLLLALWRKGERAFWHALFGDHTEQQVANYWDHVAQKCAWFSQHPARHWPVKGRLASLGIYGDEVVAYRNSECGQISIVGWTAEMSFMNDPLLRYFTIACWSEHHESPNTYHDAVGHIVASFKGLLEETWPWSDSYLCAFTCVQGDLKWLCDRMRVHNFRANEFCSQCFCVKTSDDLYATLPNFATNADQFGKREYSQEELTQKFSPLFSLPLTMDRVQHDVAHSQLLGTGKAVNGTFELNFVQFWCMVQKC